MNKLLIATNNQGKVREFKRLLEGFYDEAVSLMDENIHIHVAEDGETFLENARKKAKELSLIFENGDVLADDSGLCVEALGGRPGVYSARYAGEHAGDDENNNKLLREMASQTDRRAKFVCALAIYRNGKEKAWAIGECGGEITDKPQGENGFGYDPLFFVKEYGQTFAELDASVKNEISHRAKAFQLLRAKLEGENERS